MARSFRRAFAAVGLGTLAALVIPVAVPPPALAAATNFPETIAIPPGSLPEGITSGPGTTFYAGSRADGSVYRGDLRSGTGSNLVPGVPGRIAVGMQYEAARDRLWVAGGTTGAVTVYDADDGSELGRWVIPGSGFLNDVTVTRTAVYVTDSMVQRLVVIPLGSARSLPPADGFETLPLSGDLVFGPGFNANGIRALPGGTSLVVVSRGDLFKVDAATGVADLIEVSGGDLVGGDGLILRGRTLYVVRGGGGDDVALLQLNGHATSATIVGSITDSDLDVPTTGTIAAGRLWVVNGRFTTPPEPTTPYWITRLPLR